MKTCPMESEVKINLNRCTPEQLCSFDPGLPFNLAHKIIAHRRRKGDFQSIENVLDVRGVGLKTYRRLKKKFFVSSNSESAPSVSNRFNGNDSERRVKRRSTRIKNFINNRPRPRPNIPEVVVDSQDEPTNHYWRDFSTSYQRAPCFNQDGLMIFLKGGIKDYSKELDGIQITFTPKRGDCQDTFFTSSPLQKQECNRICHTCSKRQNVSDEHESHRTSEIIGDRPQNDGDDVFSNLSKGLGHSQTSPRVLRDPEGTEFVTPHKTPQEIHPTSWKNDRFYLPSALSRRPTYGSMYFTPIDKQTQTESPDDGCIRADQDPKDEREHICENEVYIAVEKESMNTKSCLEGVQKKLDTPEQHRDESPIDNSSNAGRVPQSQISEPVDETNSTPEENDGLEENAHQHSSRRRRQHFNRDVPRCLRHGHPKRCKCRGYSRKRYRDRHLAENQNPSREEFFQCTIL